MAGMTTTQAIIICGGLGTRLGSLVKDTPKPMLHVGGRPILEHTIDLLAHHGISRILLAAGYRADVVREHFADSSRRSVDVRVSVEPEPLGTAGSLGLVADQLDDQFLVLYGDEFVDFDVRGLLEAHASREAMATLLARPSTHPWDAHLIQADDEGRVTEIVTEHVPGRRYKNLGNASVYAVSRSALEFIRRGRPCDFMRDVFPAALAAGKRLFVHPLRSGEYVKDMGTPERFAQVEGYLEQRAAIREARAQRERVTTVFLDRDGVLNREVDLLRQPEQLEILPGVPDALKLFNRHGIRTIVVTNQPVIARGLCDVPTLDRIHKTLEQRLGGEGAHLDAIYYCPHHPETQHGEGVRELRRACECRKPGIGMLMRARRELGVRLAGSAIVGDSATDIEAGRNAGIRTILVRTGVPARAAAATPDFVCDTLLDAARAITEGRL
jgi:histidinol-phosphate phosphatase family protein